jgi:ABC-type transporter Mla maintaining outer membrane lipid asymmetry ATPase subunit MlaF
MTQIALKDVRKTYGDLEVIHGIDLTIDSGEFVVFVGPSGCGKSTLLRIIAGLEEITGGAVEIDGEVMNNVTASERGLAMVFQSYALYPHMSVYKNMAFGLENSKMPKSEIDARVREAAGSCSRSPTTSTASPRRFRADSVSGSRLAGPSCATPRRFCSTNRCPTSMRNCALQCARNCRRCTPKSAAR